MVPIPSLWLPILLSAVVVFVISAIIHMVLPYHRSDFKKIPQDDQFLESMRKFDLAPGDYMAPNAGSPEACKDPAFVEKMKKGPLVIMTIAKGAAPSMGKELFQWFLYTVAVGIIAAYITGHALGAGATYRQVFRFAGCASFVAYGFALVQNSIWYKRSWATTWKSIFDSLVYALFTAGVFGWLWPR
ncbi:MAG: hypothetical protein AABZ94_06515 [Candidatus Eisenbacteria bacterium]